MDGLHASWFPVAWSNELKPGKFVTCEILGIPLIAFRGEGERVSVLRDLCPHRNVPLSCGSLERGTMRCAYHGWRFDGEGRCVEVPALPSNARLPVIRIDHYQTVEVQGTVWVCLSAQPHEPAPPSWATEHEAIATASMVLDCSYVRLLENLVDNPHAAFVHAGYLRGAPRNRVRALVKETPNGVHVTTSGERAERSFLFWIFRMFAGEDWEILHTEEYLQPTSARVTYADTTKRLSLCTEFVCVPIDARRTRLFYRVALRAPLASRMLVRILRKFVQRLMEQDKVILEHEERAAGDAPSRKRAAVVPDTPALWVARAARSYAARGPSVREDLREMQIEYLL